MRPLAELPEAAWAAVEGVACDLDDTLTTHGTLTSPALVALERLRAAGLPAVIVTGRPLGWAEVLSRILPVAAVVAENGGAWAVWEAGRRRVAFLDDERTRTEGMARVNRAVEAIRAEHPELRPVSDLTSRATDVALDIHEETSVPDAIVEHARAIAHAAGLYTVASTVHLHVSAREPDKARGLFAAVRDLGRDGDAVTDRWIYVGDSPNDAGAFRAMQLAVGVANVRAFEGRMPAWPAYVTNASMGEGFAEVVERLLAMREGA